MIIFSDTRYVCNVEYSQFSEFLLQFQPLLRTIPSISGGHHSIQVPSGTANGTSRCLQGRIVVSACRYQELQGPVPYQRSSRLKEVGIDQPQLLKSPTPVICTCPSPNSVVFSCRGNAAAAEAMLMAGLKDNSCRVETGAQEQEREYVPLCRMSNLCQQPRTRPGMRVLTQRVIGLLVDRPPLNANKQIVNAERGHLLRT